MRVLALEPWYGGSHEAFLDGWRRLSRHEWTVLGLPPRKWKWRMRQGPVSFARDVAERVGRGERWDGLFVSDMLDLAAFRGLAPASVRTLPAVAYFHENQLTYPVDHPSEFDYHFAFTNLTTALAADEVWWNSAFHRDSMLDALRGFLARMPDERPAGAPDAIRARSRVEPPGIEPFPARAERRPGPLRLLWAARWEEDKDPAAFFAALDLLAGRDVDFRLDVVGGGRARAVPEVFPAARERFGDRIGRWGWLEDPADYRAALGEADVFVSTARHEFFGIAAVEAAAAGAHPLLPRRLAYPEVFGTGDFYYDGPVAHLADRPAELAGSFVPGCAVEVAARYAWERRAPELDDALTRSIMPTGPGGPERKDS